MACCGRCYYCRIAGLPQKCLHLFKYGHARCDTRPFFTGTFGEYVYIKPGTGLFKVPPDMADEEAAPLMCAAATVAGGLERVGVQSGDTLLIQGAGMLGLYAAAMAKERGAASVIVTDVIDARLARARRFGADRTINVAGIAEDALVEQVRQLSNGRGADVAVEVSGSPAAIPGGIKSLRTGGRYLLQGSIYPGDAFRLDAGDVIARCLTIVGLHNYDPRHLGLALGFVYRNRAKYNFLELAGPQFAMTPAGVTAALTALEKREAIRPVINPAA